MQFSSVPTRSSDDPNKGIFAEFFLEPVKLGFRSEQEGRPIYEDREHIRIIIAGDNKTEVVREARDEDKQRFERAYQAFKAGAERIAQDGTPLKEWPEMTPAIIKELAHYNVYTVDALAALTDSQLQNIGPGGRVWRDKAQAFLSFAKDVSLPTRLVAESDRLKGEIERRDTTIAEMAREIERLKGALNAGGNVPFAPAPTDALQAQIDRLTALVEQSVVSPVSVVSADQAPVIVQLDKPKNPAGRPRQNVKV
jgi:2-methylisocitrate lyase-like PEP mutase family enzyme